MIEELYKKASDFFEIPKQTTINLGDIANKAEALSFYQYWSYYLSPVPGIFAIVYWFFGEGVKVLYSITRGLEKIFYALFELFGIFGEIDNKDTMLGKFFYWFQIVGISLFTLLLIVFAIYGLFGKPLKWKKALQQLLLVTAVCSFLPAAVNRMGEVAKESVSDAQTVGTANGMDSLALEPIKQNTVDILTLNDNLWGSKGADVVYNLDETGRIKKDPDVPLNDITANSVPSLDFGTALGVVDTEALGDLDATSANSASKILFLHYLYGGAGEQEVVAMNEHRIIGGLNIFEKVYMRYKVNYIAVYAQYITLIIVLIALSIKTVKSIFEIVVTVIVAPLIGYASVQSSKKFKELLNSISGGILSIFMEVVVLRIMLYVMQYITDATIFTGLDGMQFAILQVIVYIGAFYGAFSGISVIERFTGVSQGHSDTLQQAVGTSMALSAGGKMASAAGHVGAGAVKGGIDFAKAAPKMAQNAAGGLSKAGGYMGAVTKSVGSQGLKDTAASMKNNAAEAVNDKVGGMVDGAKEFMDDRMMEGYGKGQDHTSNELVNPLYKNAQNVEFSPGDGTDHTGGNRRNEGLQQTRGDSGSTPPPNHDPMPPIGGADNGAEGQALSSVPTQGDTGGTTSTGGLSTPGAGKEQHAEKSANTNSSGGLSTPPRSQPSQERSGMKESFSKASNQMSTSRNGMDNSLQRLMQSSQRGVIQGKEEEQDDDE